MSIPNEVEAEIKIAELGLKEAESKFGQSSLEVAHCLETCALLLRQAKIRGLDAANMAARAKVIRSQHPEPKKASAAPQLVKSETDSKKCPFCAEVIRTDAVLCRFCKKDLKKKPSKSVAVGLGPMVLAIAVFAWLLFANPGNSVLNTLLPKSKISGAAWITKGAGQSDIQRGMEIALCNESAAAGVRQARGTASGYFELMEALPSVAKEVSKGAVQVVSTDVDGKYAFTDVQPGKYYLYAAYGNDFSAAYWLLPIQVSSAQEIKIDIENGNMTELYNKN